MELFNIEQNLSAINDSILKLVSTGSFVVENKGVSDGSTVIYNTDKTPKGDVLIVSLDSSKIMYLYDSGYIRNNNKITLNTPITNGNSIYFIYMV